MLHNVVSSRMFYVVQLIVCDNCRFHAIIYFNCLLQCLTVLVDFGSESNTELCDCLFLFADLQPCNVLLDFQTVEAFNCINQLLEVTLLIFKVSYCCFYFPSVLSI